MTELKPLVLSLDAMGGDDAPEIVVKGAALARRKLPQAGFLLFGDEKKLQPLIYAQGILKDCVEVCHTAEMIKSTDQPSHALRHGRASSMRLAIDAVKSGKADACVSAGNTGALMAMAMFALRTLPSIERPAICTELPNSNGTSCMLDLGANIECDAENLVQFAVMGEVFARTVMGRDEPSIGLLNVGVEELKGRGEVKLAGQMLTETNLPVKFHGFVEGDDITRGTVDVVVTDGYTGNVALKTMEGMGTMLVSFFRDAYKSSLAARLGYLLAAGAMKRLGKRLDPRLYNGAVLLGLNGIVVKSHGGTDALGFANAIGVAADMATNEFTEKIKQDFATMRHEEKV